MTLRTVVLAFLAFLALGAGAGAQPSPMAGASSADLIDALNSHNRGRIDAALAAVEASPGAYLPPVFAPAAREFLAHGKKDKALLYFRLGTIRIGADVAYGTHVDSKAEPYTSRFTLPFIDAAGQKMHALIGRYSKDQIREQFEKAAAFDDLHPPAYDPEWTLHRDAALKINYLAAPVSRTPEAVEFYRQKRASFAEIVTALVPRD
jgi:hypothetical protein